jgi:hypothetical protein
MHSEAAIIALEESLLIITQRTSVLKIQGDEKCRLLVCYTAWLL